MIKIPDMTTDETRMIFRGLRRLLDGAELKDGSDNRKATLSAIHKIGAIEVSLSNVVDSCKVKVSGEVKSRVSIDRLLD